jgi:hypothetical protein
MPSSICRFGQKSKNKIKNKRRKTASNRAELTGSHVSKSGVICINGTSGERRRKKISIWFGKSYNLEFN